jgi:hypothetical protein
MIQSPEKCVSWGIKGWYKGFFFRSSYEYFFMKKLENEGLDLSVSLIQESFRVPYDVCDNLQYYVPDFYVPSRSCVYEVKNSYTLKTDFQTSVKHEAAKKFFKDREISFVIVLESELPIPKNSRKIRSIIENDPNVVLINSSQNLKNDEVVK